MGMNYPVLVEALTTEGLDNGAVQVHMCVACKYACMCLSVRSMTAVADGNLSSSFLSSSCAIDFWPSSFLPAKVVATHEKMEVMHKRRANTRKHMAFS